MACLTCIHGVYVKERGNPTEEHEVKGKYSYTFGGKKKKVKHAAMEMQDLLKIWGIVDIDDAAGKVAPYQMKRLAAFCYNFKELLGTSNISFLRRVDIDPTTLIGAPFTDHIGHKLLSCWMKIDEFGNGEINLNNFRRWVRQRSNIIGLCLFFNHLIFGGAIRTSRRGYYTFEEFVVLSEYICTLTKDSLLMAGFNCLATENSRGTKIIRLEGLKDRFADYCEDLQPDGDDGLNINTRLFQQLAHYQVKRARSDEKVSAITMYVV